MSTRPQDLEQLHALIARDPERAPSLARLAQLAGLSPSRLTRAFRARFGLTPSELTRSLRRDRLKQALRSGDDVTGAIYTAGFGSPSRVYEEGSHLIGMTPGSYRRGAEGVAIRYTIVRSPVGPLLVAATERGVCAVTLGDDDASLEAGLAHEFPAAARTRVDEGADDWLAAVVRRVAEQLGLAEPHAPRALPADLRATAFQWRVWHALTRIPGGETRSYSDIAREIGQPRAVRAVARACASNRLAIVVPCHRVIREDGSPGGYRWGLPRKQALRELERRNAQRP